MQTFLGLPNEILLNIVENIQFEDIESVTLSCKQIRNLAPKILDQHLSRKLRFETVAIGQIQVCFHSQGNGSSSSLLCSLYSFYESALC